MNTIKGIPPLINQGVSNISDAVQFERFCLQATNNLFDILKPCFGPFSSDKLIVNHLETSRLDNDASKIFSDLQILNPICRLIERCNTSLSEKCNDGSTYFVLITCHLLTISGELLKNGVDRREIKKQLKALLKLCRDHISSIKLPLSIASNNATNKSNNDKREERERVLETHLRNSLETKLTHRSAFLLNILKPLIKATNFVDENSFHLVRREQKPFKKTELIEGYAVESLPLQPLDEEYEKESKKVIIYSCSIETASTETKGTVLLKSAEELLNYSVSEESLLESNIIKLKEMGIKFIITAGSFSVLAKQFMAKHGINGIVLKGKFDLRKAVNVTGGSIKPFFDIPTESEIGECFIREYRDCVVLKGVDNLKENKDFTLFLCSQIGLMAQKADRAVRRAVGNLVRMKKSEYFLAGGGKLEAGIYCLLKEKGKELGVDASFWEFGNFIIEKLCSKSNIEGMNKEEVFKAILGGEGKVGVDVCRKEVGEGIEVVDSFEMKYYVFELIEEVINVCLGIDDVYFSKLSGGMDYLNDPRGFWDERENVEY